MKIRPFENLVQFNRLTKFKSIRWIQAIRLSINQLKIATGR